MEKSPNDDTCLMAEFVDIEVPVVDNVPVLQLAVEQHLYAMPVPLVTVVVGHVDDNAHRYEVAPNTLAAYIDSVY